ncbi:hypothetical protein C7476_11581 [Phyllobacterium bourgognense]|uniref:Uncharacterized protein n=1 Tax=Phyllobacterium bourgognense TaxID=314236 RepID=A0A368YLC8_9HYPH|nr:hypothetical protein C7476_11581 [Phyllobacterium bourgognense]
MVGFCSPVSPASRTAAASTASTPIGGRPGHPVQATSSFRRMHRRARRQAIDRFCAPAGEQRRYVVDEALDTPGPATR